MFFYKINGQHRFDKFGRGWILINQLNPNLTKAAPLHDGLLTGQHLCSFVMVSRNRKRWEMEVGSLGSLDSFLWVLRLREQCWKLCAAYLGVTNACVDSIPNLKTCQVITCSSDSQEIPIQHPVYFNKKNFNF